MRLSPLLLSALAAARAAAAPDCVITFNEIAWNPAAGQPEWIELHNQFSIPVDIGGWTLTGGMAFAIPDGTVMAPGACLVISATAGSPPGALGPFTGILDNAGDELRLNKRDGRLMDRVDYSNGGAWPALSPGFTMAKSWPLSASEPAANWLVSAQSGGTPGAENFTAPAGGAASPPAQRIAFNAGSQWKVAPSGTPAAGWTLFHYQDSTWTYGAGILGSADVAGTPPATLLPARAEYYFRRGFAVPPGLENAEVLLTGKLRGEAWIYIDGVEVAHAPAQDGPLNRVLTLPSLPAGGHLLAVKLAVAAGDAGAGWDAALALATPDTSLPPPPAAVSGPVVINEIHYHNRPQYRDSVSGTPYQENGTEFIELHNPGGAEVDLAGWRLTDAVSYTFPAGTNLPAGGFLVVNQSQWDGSLSNGGERVRLRHASGDLIDEVNYADGGRWPDDADGGGSSMELIDPRADNARAENWAASIEPPQPWQTVTYRAPGTEPPGTNNPDTWREFLLGMLDAGTVLVDDVSVIEDPDGAPVQVIQNGSFESDTIGSAPQKWRCLGTHKLSTVIANPDGPGKVLRLVATGQLEHTYNNCSTTFGGNRVINTTKTYEISFKAKWVSGSPQLNSRLYLNRCARTTILNQPAATGTPGTVNSRRIANAGPSFDRLQHSPVIPAATQAVRVGADISDPDGIAEVTLFYRLDGGPWQQTGMAGGNGGRFTGIIPGQADGAVVQFYVQAVDGAGAAAVFPAGGAESRALFRTGDGGGAAQAVRTQVRCLMLRADADALHHPLHGVSNFRWGCTLIDGGREVYYDAGVHLRAAPYGRNGPRAGWNIRTGPHQPFRGVHNTIVIDGAFNMARGDGTGWLENTIGPSVNEMLYQVIANRAGDMGASYDDICWFQAPLPGYDRLAQLKLARFNDSYLDSIYEGGEADGSLYKQELIYFPTATVDGNPESLKNPYNNVRDLDIRSLGPAVDSYRFTYLLQNHSDRDDFRRIMAMCASFDSPPAALYANTFAAIDTESWMRVLAMNALTGLLDTYNMGLAHNIMFYARPSDGRIVLMPWDQDHSFYSATNANIFGMGTHRVRDIINLPQNRRLFCKHLLDLCETGFRNDYLDPFISALCTAAQRPGYIYNFKTWVQNRRAYVLGQIAAQHPAVAFSLTTNGGNDFTVSGASTLMTGSGWVDVHAIRLDNTGELLPVTWTGGNTWQVTVPLAGGVNAISLTALTKSGATAGSDSINITNNGPEAASAANIVLSEIHYHPPDPDGATLEFIELHNIGPRTADFTSCAFTAGVNFTFPAGFSVAPGGYALVVQNTAAFTARYGAGLPVAGEWSATTRLSNGGDRITLQGAGGALIRDFSYDDAAPWPVAADGGGPSLVLISPATNPDHALAASWRASTSAGGSPGAGDPAPPAPFNEPLVRMEDALLSAPRVALSAGAVEIHWTETPGLKNASLIPEISRDLQHWENNAALLNVEILSDAPDGRRMLARPDMTRGALFFRLRLSR